MQTPIQQVLDQLISDGEDDVVEVQLVFHPGLQMSAGALKHGPIPGTYCLGAVGHATADMPGRKKGDLILTEQIFDAAAVQRVMRAVDMPSKLIQAPGTH